MDRLHIALMRQIMQEDASSPVTLNPIRSLRVIADRLDVDKETVRSRMRQLEDQGFRTRSAVALNPALARLRFGLVWTRGWSTDAKRAWIDRLQAQQNVIVVTDYLGDAVTLVVAKRDEESDEDLLAGLPPSGAGVSLLYRPMAFPPCGMHLSNLDRRIVAALQPENRHSYAAIARAAGLPARTVQRRLANMIDQNALFVIPSFDPQALDASTADLTVFYETGASKAETDEAIAARVGEQMFRMEVHNVDHSFFNLVLSNAAHARSILDWVRSLPGVAWARLDVITQRIELLHNLPRLFEGRVES